MNFTLKMALPPILVSLCSSRCSAYSFFAHSSFAQRRSELQSLSSLKDLSMAAVRTAGRRFLFSKRMMTSNKDSHHNFPSIYGKTLVSIEDSLHAMMMMMMMMNDENKKDGKKDVSGCGADEEGSVLFVDGSWYHKGGRNGRMEYENGPRIKGAKYVDIDDISSQKELFPERNPKGLPHMMPPKRLFEAAMDEIGITNADHVIVYGREGCLFTPRTWFLFRAMGHDPNKIHLLQGSYEEWEEAGGLVETNPVKVFHAKHLDITDGMEFIYKGHEASNVCDMKYITENIISKDSGEVSRSYLLDSRGTSFNTNGHIPGAIHIPYSSLVQPDNPLKFKKTKELKKIFDEAKVDIIKNDDTIVCTCGSGVSVCHLVVALEECGREIGKTIIYDGSWAEWGSDPDSPKEFPS